MKYLLKAPGIFMKSAMKYPEANNEISIMWFHWTSKHHTHCPPGRCLVSIIKVVTTHSYGQSRDGQKVMVLHIPCTKIVHQGEDVCWAKQDRLTNPDATLVHLLEINAPLDNAHLFAYHYKTGHWPLTKLKFIAELTKVAQAARLEPLQGHRIRIGSMLEYLLQGMPFNIMKVKGWWSSNTFILYLRKHMQILAPYIQAVPTVQDTFTCLTMPSDANSLAPEPQATELSRYLSHLHR